MLSSYTAVRSLYTIATYEKAADIFRMMMLVIGKNVFYKSISDFLKAYDGKAVTIEEVLDYLTKSTGCDMHNFLSWFTEPGIPKVTVSEHYDSERQLYRLDIKNTDESNKPIPLLMGLLDNAGTELIKERLLLINNPTMRFEFPNLPTRPIASLLRSFSAPIYLCHNASNEDLLVLIQHDSNLYNRCEAAKKLILNLVTEYCATQTISYPPLFFSFYRSLLENRKLEPWILAELLTIQSEEVLIASFENPQFELLAEARLQIQKKIALKLKDDWSSLLQLIADYRPNANPQFNLFDIKDAGMRRLKELYFSYLQHIDPIGVRNALIEQFKNKLNLNMTETISSLNLLAGMDSERNLDEALNQFYNYWKHDSNAINYWFKTQGAIHSDYVVGKVKKLLDHPAFDISNPNKIYALLGSFIINPYGFHNSSGEGYQLITKVILILDKLNPPLAANLVQKFALWEKYDEHRKKLMQNNLILIEKDASSADVKNGAQKALTGK